MTTPNTAPNLPAFPKATIEGYPRIGANRELKRALEAFWSGRINEEEFRSAARALRVETYNRLAAAGLSEDYAIPADVAFYDQVLETALTVGALQADGLQAEFDLARGTKETPALEMTKWFDTNYHYIVPEIADDHEFKANPQRIVDIFEQARAAGHTVRPVLVGPVTLLALAKSADTAATAPLDHLGDVLPAYAEVLRALAAAGAGWVQLVEPALVADLTAATDQELADAATRAYSYLGALEAGSERPQLYVTTPYGAARKGLEALAALAAPAASSERAEGAADGAGEGAADGIGGKGGAIDALQVDLSVGTLSLEPDYLETVAKLPVATLVAGLVDGRNIWAADLRDLRAKLEKLQSSAQANNVSVSTSVSLQHVPHTVAAEASLPVDVANWFSFADEKVAEIVALSAGPLDAADAYAVSDRAVRTRRDSTRTHNDAVQARTATLPEGQVQRQPEYAGRREAQKSLNLPPLPTTTIGSFPQTQEIRAARAAHRAGELNDDQYTEALRDEVKSVIELQERLGLDVLVHGEPERNDMVQYFAELLDGFVVTENGWVQSYGSRCTRPPIVVGDISRPAPMTVEWAKFAQSLSDKPVKGMLTGPVTILAWSFVRDDVHQSLSADQLGVALADEVRDLEDAGINIIQIDEPALRELLPLREEDRKDYLDWAVRSFRLVALEAKPQTQIHTHLCYSEFGQIIDAVAGLDADVTSIEAARSRMELLADIDDRFYSELGPGIYDIHSPRVPSVAEQAELIRAALKNFPADRLWINPDCGLKTRGYAETESALRNMVLARDEVAATL